jgi:hypothetical protein
MDLIPELKFTVVHIKSHCKAGAKNVFVLTIAMTVKN